MSETDVIQIGTGKSVIKENLALIPGTECLDLCLTCGACVAGCHLASLNLDVSPRKLVRMVVLGLDNAIMQSRDFVWQCSMCRRCTEACPAGLKMDKIVRETRKLFFQNRQCPVDLQSAVEESLTLGNNSEITEEDFIDTVEWLEEELRDEVEDENVRIPLDQQDAQYLFLPNPREIKFLPMLLMAAAKVMYRIGASWTMSTKCFDVTNWAYYTGDQEAAEKIINRTVQEMKRLNVKELLITECGHGYRVLKVEAPRWLGSPLPFNVTSIIELMAENIKNGTLQPDPDRIPQPVTYHDPCNLARKGGVIEEPRYILNHAVSRFVEMIPNRALNYCCGGGGGVAQNSWFSESKYGAGLMKIDQIKRSNAEILVTSCQTCYSHITDLINKHKLKVKVKTMTEIVADAID